VLCQSSFQARTFEGVTFDEALRRAGTSGSLKLACVEKQIAFLARRGPDTTTSEPESHGLRSSMGIDPPAASLSLNEETSPFLKFAGGIHALLHETQHERGISTLFAASSGRLLSNKLAAQWRRTDRQRLVLVDLMRSFESAPPSAVVHRLDRAGALLGRLPPTRAGLSDQHITAPRIIEDYSAINTELLAALDAYMVTGAIGPERSGALACLALLYAKEKTGIERAQLADAFFADRFSEGQRLSVATAIAAQASYLHIFSAAAPRAAEQLLRRMLASRAAVEVQRMEKVVFAGSEAGFGIDASTWFTLISRKIDMLGDVSSSVMAMLRGNR
jgi:methyl-accepting chemotaxis protein